jgi:hypothetical protein
MGVQIRTDTNLRDLDLNTIAFLVVSQHVYIIIRVVRGLRVAPFVLTGE